MDHKNNKLRYYLYFTLAISVISLFFILYSYSSSGLSKASLVKIKELHEEKKAHVKNQVATAINTINVLKDGLNNTLKADLKERVDNAYAMAINLYNKNKSKLSEKELKNLIKESLRPIRFNDNRGYYFILDKEGTIYLQPIDSSIENTNILSLKNSKDEYPIVKLVEQAKDKESAYVTYYWKLFSSKDSYSHLKTSYIRNLPFYGWFIGTGDYLTYVEEHAKARAIDYIKKIRYDEHGYIYVYDRAGNALFTKNDKAIEMYNISSLKDDNGLKIFPRMLEESDKEDGGYFRYKLSLKSNELPMNLQAYVKSIPGWNWIVGGFTELGIAKEFDEL